MSPVQHYSAMETVNGNAPITDQYNRISKLSATLNVVEKTAAYTCLVEESGTVFVANHASSAVNFTLPTIAASLKGVYFDFVNKGAAGMVITSDPSDKLVVDNDVAADTLTWSTASHIIGGACRVVCDGALWYTMAWNYASTATAAS